VADSSPNPTSPSGEPRPSSERLPSASRASVPPSEPRGSRASLSSIDAQVDRPARLQLIVALILGLVLVAIPLYLWRRPRAASVAVVVPQDGGVMVEPPAPPPEPDVTVSEPKASCHDPGPKRTPPDQCDHLTDVEKALAKAIEDTASCVPKDLGGGTIVYGADVTLTTKRRTLVVSTPRDGRSIKNAKVISACHNAVKAKMQSVPLEGLKHEHHRYRIHVTATYRAAEKP
jgi:hypothetical protein